MKDEIEIAYIIRSVDNTPTKYICVDDRGQGFVSVPKLALASMWGNRDTAVQFLHVGIAASEAHKWYVAEIGLTAE